MERERYVPPKAHRCDPEWMAALDERHRQLHELAQEKLGSSYFADRTHGISKIIKEAAAAAVTANHKVSNKK
jgi:hypothetical protein